MFNKLHTINLRMLSETRDKLVEQKNEICQSWIKSPNANQVLLKYNIEPNLFIRHFGIKILDHVIDIVEGNKDVNQSPIMYTMTLFFKTKNINLNDIFILCTEFIYSLQQYFDDQTCLYLIDIVDNKLNIVEDYMDISRDEINIDQFFVLNTKTDETRLKDIRFTSPNDLNSNELFNLLDDNQITKMYDLQQTTDDTIVLLDKIISLDAIQSYEQIPIIISLYENIITNLNTIALFPIITTAFEDLNIFISTLKLENFHNEEKRSLLFIMLTGLSEDLSKWVDTIFIQKIAEDIYYCDASFANNCLEIELIFDDNHESKDTDLDNQIMMEDDLMTHFL